MGKHPVKGDNPTMLKLALLFLSVLTLNSALAGIVTQHTLTLKDGTTLKVSIDQYLNSRGMRELKIQTNDLSKITLGFGRDVNQNGVIESFYLIGKDGIEIHQREAAGESSKTRALKLLKQHSDYSGFDYYKRLASNLVGYLYISYDNVRKAQNTFYQDFMDLSEVWFALNNKSLLLTPLEKAYLKAILVKGQDEAIDRLKNSMESSKKLVGVDAVLWAFGGIIIKGAAKTFGMRKANAYGAAAVAKFSLPAVKSSVATALKGLTARTALNYGKRITTAGVKAATREWKYIAFSTGVQLGAEGYVNYNSIKDPNPAVLAENLLKEKSVQQNVSMDVLQTILSTGAIDSKTNKSARYALLGMIGASSSGAVIAASGEKVSSTRTKFDTAWTLAIDTTQMILELKVLHHFQTQAVKSKNPKLKIVGYAVVLVSQVAGYYGYAKATKFVNQEEMNQGKVLFVPVIAQ